jgi:hypothetical protein
VHLFRDAGLFKYLGCLRAQDNDDIQAVRQQIRKARGIWARVGQVLRGENVAPCVAAKFYKAVVQSVLLYGSETWLEGFHIRAAFRMAKLRTVKYYIDPRHSTIAMYVVNRPILRECKEGERMRGSMPQQWWWEQELGLDV